MNRRRCLFYLRDSNSSLVMLLAAEVNRSERSCGVAFGLWYRAERRLALSMLEQHKAFAALLIGNDAPSSYFFAQVF